MKNFPFILLFLSLSIPIFSQESANFGEPKFAPSNGKKLLIIGQDLGSVGGLNLYTNGYIDNVGTAMPSGVTSYTSIESLGGLTATANWGAGDIRGQAYVEDEDFDQSFIVIGLYLVGILDQINNGQKDNNIRTFANWVKGQNRPVFIRIGYEFEGPWNNYNPTKFQNAWRYIVHIFDEEEVRNAAYVWQSAGLNNSSISSWYPGDEYVNWVGYSQFDGQNMGQSIKNFAIQKNKPIMIAEAAPRVVLSSGDGQFHWDNWFEPLFDEIYANDRIKALAYINANWDLQPMWTGQGWGDSRVEANAVVKQNWENEIAKEPWLMAGESLFDSLFYQDYIITNTSNISFSEENKLSISHQPQEIQIQLIDNELMEELIIWDMSGKILFQDNTSRNIYKVATSKILFQNVVITIKTKGKLLSKITTWK